MGHTLGMRSLLLNAIAILNIGFSHFVHAQLSVCKAESPKIQEGCNSAVEQATAIKSGMSASASAVSGGQGQSQKGYSLANVTGTGAEVDDQVAAHCESLKKKCDQVCDPSKAAAPREPQRGQEQKEIDKEKEACNKSLDKTIAQGKESARQLREAEKKSENTGQQAQSQPQNQGQESDKGNSGGNGSPTPQPNNSPKSDEPKKENKVTFSAQANCGSDQAYLFEQCADQLATECLNKPREGKCQSFSARYCSKSASTSESSPGALRAGSGLSKDYCKNLFAGDFCSVPGREACPSCNRTAPAKGAQVADACLSDPYFANPTATLSAQSTSGAAAVGGGARAASSGSGGGTVGGAAAASVAAVAGQAEGETSPGAKIGFGDGGGSGGGGGYSPASQGSSDSGSDGKSASSAGGKSAVPTLVQASDVQAAAGPSVFVMASEVWSKRCANGMFVHCQKLEKK